MAGLEGQGLQQMQDHADTVLMIVAVTVLRPTVTVCVTIAVIDTSDTCVTVETGWVKVTVATCFPTH